MKTVTNWTTEPTNNDTTLDELYEYVGVLEGTVASLETTNERLTTLNDAMRRSIAAYKANATRRRRVLEGNVQ